MSAPALGNGAGNFHQDPLRSRRRAKIAVSSDRHSFGAQQLDGIEAVNRSGKSAIRQGV